MSAVGEDGALLPICETFASVQGEGTLAGAPSHFIRFSGCNLRCRWCDTPFASWSPQRELRTLTSVIEEVCASELRHVVITGGEPMLFDAVGPLTTALRALEVHTTVETAGTIHRSRESVPCDLLSMSPKLANSTPLEGDERDKKGMWRRLHEDRRLSVEVLQAMLDDHPRRQLKFVVCDESDLREIERLLRRLRGWNGDEVFLMPEGVERVPVEMERWVRCACDDRGWRYGRRLHIELFGNVRGR